MSWNDIQTVTGVGTSPTDVTVNPTGTRAYVSNLDGTVAVITTTTGNGTGTITGRITTPAPATSAALTPDGTVLLVAGTNDTVTAIDVATATVISTLVTDPTPDTTSTPSLAVAANGTIYQTDNTDNALRILHLGTAGPNQPPVAGNDTATVAEGAATTIAVLANDTDADGTINPATVVITQQPTNGSATANANGTISYVSNGAEVSTDSFRYTVKDNTGATSNTATVTLTVTAVNDAPVAVNDTATVAEGATTTIAVLANDTDADGTINPATVVITQQPTNGSATANANGTITYVSNGAEVSTDSFRYTVKDNTGATSNTATVTLTITAVNDAPTVGTRSWAHPTRRPGAVGVTVVAIRPRRWPVDLHGERHPSSGAVSPGAVPGIVHLHPDGAGPPARRHHPRRGHRPVHRHRQRRSGQCRRPGNRAGDTGQPAANRRAGQRRVRRYGGFAVGGGDLGQPGLRRQ